MPEPLIKNGRDIRLLAGPLVTLLLLGFFGPDEALSAPRRRKRRRRRLFRGEPQSKVPSSEPDGRP